MPFKEMVLYFGGGARKLEQPPLILSEAEQPLADVVCNFLIASLNAIPHTQDEVKFTIPKELGLLPDEEFGFQRLMTFVEDWAYQVGWTVVLADNWGRTISLRRLPPSPYQELPQQPPLSS